ncbi:hypothetical protein GGR32_002378 [Mesonia hippocampi]|uniref:UPF0246 protein GGR32_002378 n=1 Tax=Mesonia hippocampi TaxID=1628250 RepID=A0A840EWW4_9FLAO|nr:peroxide stress protein YaaA [Mesonia hippocampi]MBB4120066.1 hypothetical protein [Mesonia hippocampi]
MKIVISPAKSLELAKKIPTQHYTQPIFMDEAVKINQNLASCTKVELSKLMNISDKLAELNFERYKAFSVNQTQQNARQAVYTFNGDVYTGLDAYALSETAIENLQDKLRILSGLYGVLKPLDLIQAYRLEMGTKLALSKTENLYEFWSEKITHALNEELSEDELFINLASNEYFKAIDKKNLKVPIIAPVFKDFKNGKLKVISFYAKRARGAMVRYIVNNNVQTLPELRGFNLGGYAYSEEFTQKENEPVFIR